MIEFITSPLVQAAAAFWVTNILLGVITAGGALIGSAWLMAGRISRDEIPGLAKFVGFAVFVVATIGWSSLTPMVFWFVPEGWGRTALNVMQGSAVVLAFGFMVLLSATLPNATEFFQKRKGKVGEKLVSRKLEQLGYEHLNDQFVGDQADVAQVDHIVRVGGSVLVLETKNIEGKLYPKPDGTLSLQIKDDKAPTTIPDPVKQNERQVRAVLRIAQGIPVKGTVVFAKLSEFPQGLPQGCVRIKDLGAYLRLMAASTPESPETLKAWSALKEAIGRLDREEMKARHVEMISDNTAFRSLPRGTMVCRGCQGANVTIAYGYSYHWKCQDCSKRSVIRVDEGESLVMDGQVLYRVGPKGKTPVEGQGVCDEVAEVKLATDARPADKPITWPKPRLPLPPKPPERPKV